MYLHLIVLCCQNPTFCMIQYFLINISASGCCRVAARGIRAATAFSQGNVVALVPKKYLGISPQKTSSKSEFFLLLVARSVVRIDPLGCIRMQSGVHVRKEGEVGGEWVLPANSLCKNT